MSHSNPADYQPVGTTDAEIIEQQAFDPRSGWYTFYRCTGCGDEHTNRRRLRRRCGCFDK